MSVYRSTTHRCPRGHLGLSHTEHLYLGTCSLLSWSSSSVLPSALFLMRTSPSHSLRSEISLFPFLPVMANLRHCRIGSSLKTRATILDRNIYLQKIQVMVLLLLLLISYLYSESITSSKFHLRTIRSYLTFNVRSPIPDHLGNQHWKRLTGTITRRL